MHPFNPSNSRSQAINSCSQCQLTPPAASSPVYLRAWVDSQESTSFRQVSWMVGEWKLLHPALYEYSRNLDHLTGARTLSPWSPESWPCDPVEPNVAARSVLWALGRREPEFEESIGSKCFPKRFWVSSLWSKIVVYKAMMTETSYGSVKSSLPVLGSKTK